MSSLIRRLLFVDDEKELHDLVDVVLEDLKLLITHCLSGEKGLEAMKQDQEFAVVISNYHMGHGMTGGDFLKSVKQLSPKSSRILVTGGMSEGDLGEMLKKGDIDGYAIKPIFVDNFIGQVEKGLAAYALA